MNDTINSSFHSIPSIPSSSSDSDTVSEDSFAEDDGLPKFEKRDQKREIAKRPYKFHDRRIYSTVKNMNSRTFQSHFRTTQGKNCAELS